jgi:hypothetical protein
MARNSDGAMIWGGADAVTEVRSLPFPHWAQLSVFGPRLSVAAMDVDAWSDEETRCNWCQRIARDVWQFDQQACSSPQALFLENPDSRDPSGFVGDLRRAFEFENAAHARTEIVPSLTSAICQARAAWLFAEGDHAAFFPESADWTILLGTGTKIPTPTQGRTLTVLITEDLKEVIDLFDGSVQTLGLGFKDQQKERRLVELAARRGVDRIVKIGQMHTFGSPWDGKDLIRPLVRIVRHVPSADEEAPREHGRRTVVSGSVGS